MGEPGAVPVLRDGQFAATAGSKAADAAMEAAARRGIDLPPGVAAQVARAVLECADDEYRVKIQVAAEYWPAARGKARERLGVQMAQELVAAGLLPAALPREVVTPGRQPWDTTTVEFVVPVRRPPDDR